MKEIRWGIIGCGDVTEVKSGPGFQLAENSSLVAVMRRSGELAKDYAERHNVPKWYDKADDLVSDSEVDAVYIATPPGSHKEYTDLVAKAGKPVYVEKPMALNTEECQAMIDVCEEHHVPLYVAYYRRRLPRFLKVKELLDEGAIGDVRFVTMEQTQRQLEKDENGEWPWRVRPEVSGGGLFYDVASHTLDLFDFLLGPIEQVKGYADNLAASYPAEDSVSGTFRFESGVMGTGVWNFSSYKNEDRNRIVGTKGEIIFSTFDEVPIKLINRFGTEEFHIDRPSPIQQHLIQTIVDELLGEGESPSTRRSALRTNRVMDEMVQAYYNG
ncbi:MULTISPECIES: Gfo/Idh/MocA family protein [Pontibacillus]|uniref:Gfo/Idh/MocA family oxidoreductase n=1 Tax=Pontibacillus chungwhensis TaxID=265426 RepID=A0ABY8V152_9BACI|nr:MULTISPECIES: Gfo/Idh/MocA family oxidoreductase [Pontibacillus]MCD5324541.1 Gfo/Idh/MocA family oxidoreductase [Pontibacillus sp. HN14]WIF99163.1 Gfo/Idh/MocA family oxidoreductase [Pontibacillus chungwhensis]